MYHEAWIKERIPFHFYESLSRIYKSRNKSEGSARCEKESTMQDHPQLENSKRVPSFPPGIINNRVPWSHPREKIQDPPCF